MTVIQRDGRPNDRLLIQQSMVAWQRYHTLKELHFLVEYLFMSIIINNNTFFSEKLCISLFFMLAAI